MRSDRRGFIRATLASLALPSAGTAEPWSETSIDIGRHFRGQRVEGTFVLQALHDDTLLVHDPRRADREFLPASTFKIPNSLIALETGAIADEDEVLAWNGQKQGPEHTWKSQSLRTAIAASAVWFYQEMARRVGETRMREWIDRIGYGNRDIGGGIDQFWLTGGLRIAARQQVEFLRRLQADELPFSERTRRVVKDILVLETRGGYVLRGKTGLSRPGEVGWFVGWVERDRRAWVFASNVAMTEHTPIALRKDVALEVLRGLGLVDQAPRS